MNESIAYLAGAFIAKLLSIAGIGGFIAGLFIRKWPAAAAAGIAMGVLQTLVLSAVRDTPVGAFSWIMAIFVAVLMATLGWWIRTGRHRNKAA